MFFEGQWKKGHPHGFGVSIDEYEHDGEAKMGEWEGNKLVKEYTDWRGFGCVMKN